MQGYKKFDAGKKILKKPRTDHCSKKFFALKEQTGI
jgi:hypothetical protein